MTSASADGDGDQLKGWQIAAICFDAGDTLIFDEPPFATRAAAALDAHGIEYDSDGLPEAIRGMLRYGVELYTGGLALDSAELARLCAGRFLSAVAPSADEAAARQVALSFAEQPFKRSLEPGTASLLLQLKRRGFLLGIISDWEPDLPDVLDALGILNLFDCVSVSSLVGACKPSLALFRHALACLGVPAENSLHVGDYSEIDVAGANAAGMHAFLYDKRGLYRQGKRPDGVPYAATLAELGRLLLALTPPKADRDS